jgi:hypothetical protein
MQRYCPLNSSIALNGELPVKNAIVAFNPPPGSSIRGKPVPGLLIADANGASFVELASSSFARLLGKYAWHRGHRRCRGPVFQYVASCRIIHIGVLPKRLDGVYPDETLLHSCRRAFIGSIRDARLAGT